MDHDKENWPCEGNWEPAPSHQFNTLLLKYEGGYGGM